MRNSIATIIMLVLFVSWSSVALARNPLPPPTHVLPPTHHGTPTLVWVHPHAEQV